MHNHPVATKLEPMDVGRMVELVVKQRASPRGVKW